jgi:hypothetical protein
MITLDIILTLALACMFFFLAGLYAHMAVVTFREPERVLGIFTGIMALGISTLGAVLTYMAWTSYQAL